MYYERDLVGYSTPISHRKGYGIWVISLLSSEMDLVTWVQILDETVYVSFRANVLGKGMNPSILYQTAF